MVKSVAFIAFLSLLTPLSAMAVTLIVTHPETEFDIDSEGGPATKALLSDPQYGRKIVLRSDPKNKFTFDPKSSNFSTVKSLTGALTHLRIDPTESEYVLAGGFLWECFYITFDDLMRSTNRDLKIGIHMAATYDSDGILSSRDNESNKKIALDFVKWFVNQTQASCQPELRGGTGSLGHRVQVFLHGQELATLGVGSIKVQLYFE